MVSRRNLSEEDRLRLSEQNSELLAAMRAEFGSDSIMKMEGTGGLWPEDKIIHTGSIELDTAIGIGGLPRGRLIQVHGMESSGKTTTALMTVAEAQKQGLNVLYIDAESSLDPNWMTRLGVDLSNCLVSQPNNLETAIEMIISGLNKGFGLVVIDSIAALKAAVVMEADAFKETRALEARRWSTQLPRVVQAARETGGTCLFINQMREAMDMYTPASLPGGKAIKFNMSVMIEMKKKLEGKNNDEGIDYHDSMFKIIKNKVGSPFKHGDFRLYTREGEPVRRYDEEATYAAIKREVIQSDTKVDDDGSLINKKNWYYLPLDAQDIAGMKEDQPERDLDDVQFVNEYQMSRLWKKLDEYPSLYSRLEDKVYSSLNNNVSDSVDSASEGVGNIDLPDGYEVDEETGELTESPGEDDVENLNEDDEQQDSDDSDD